MALPLPQGREIQVYKRVMSGEFKMESLEAAPDHYMINFIVHGDRTIITPYATYTVHAGELVTVPPFLYHKTAPASSEYYESVLIKFSKKFVKPLTDNLGNRIVDKIYKTPCKEIKNEKINSKVFDIAWDMLEISENPKDDVYDNFKLRTLLFQLLLLLYENVQEEDNISTNPSVLSPQIMDAVYYIESEYAGTLSIECAAKRTGYSVSYFSRLFQKQLGVSFSEYCNNARLKHVQFELLTTDKSITEIALDTGFSFPGNMTMLFKKKYGITPLQYRKQQSAALKNKKVK